jgi:uncharacterized peroxidase-related enzyme
MAWIEVIDEDKASGELKAIYEKQGNEAGAVANILKVHSLLPGALSAHMNLYGALMYGPGLLSRAQREMIAVVVSAVNGCDY